ncbi:hypothetical protein Tco_0851517 [Tanacetum coccineum]
MRGHKFPRKFLMLMANEKEDATQDAIGDQDEALQSGDISILNSLKMMDFTLEGDTHMLQRDVSLRMKLISLHNMQALLDTDKAYGGIRAT